MHTKIAKWQPLVTLINVFTVDPADQQELVDTLVEATDQVMSKLPGFVSANIHRSLDGKRVANYAQWRTREDFEAIFKNPEVAPHMQRCKELATNDASLYEVICVENHECVCHTLTAANV